ncbi:hypothetical protein VpaJT1_3 [Vibrio phage VpaJT_1]|nr:hypothetical protein VpaJT1_3 [Vibrio phage VpaJT_1]
MFGRNLTWFLNEASVSVDDLKESGMIPADIDIYGETPEGADTSCNVDIKDLLSESAKRIENLEQAINETIGYVESTGGCEESIRRLRDAL